MNQKNFTLANVITLLTAVTFGFVCFLGTNFLTLGNNFQSILLALIIIILLTVTSLGAKLLKRTSRNFKTCFIWEMILLVLFTGLMVLFTISPFSHYFKVWEQKTQIQSELEVNITQAENLFSAYEQYAENRKNKFKEKLSSVVAAKNYNPSGYAAIGFKSNGIPDSKQVQKKLEDFDFTLFPSNYKKMKLENIEWLGEAKQTTVSWKPISVVNIVNSIEQNSNLWHNELITLSKNKGIGEQSEDFKYNLSFENTKKHFTESEKPSWLAILLAIVAFLLMLFSWFVTIRSGKNNFGKTINKDNTSIEY